MNYPVPDFGVEPDIIATQKNIVNAQNSLDHDWVYPKDGYNVGWATNNKEFIQTESNIARDPLLSKDASPLLVHQKPAYAGQPVDYFVPDFGISHEIGYTQESIKNAETQLKH